MAASCAPRHRSIAMGLWSTFIGVAFALSAAIAPWVMSDTGVAGLFRLHGAALALALPVCMFILPTDGAAAGQRTGAPRPHLLLQHARIYTSFRTAVPGICFLCYTVTAIALLTFLPQVAGATTHWLAVALPVLVMAGSVSAGWLAQHRVSPLQLLAAAFGDMALAGCLLAAGLHIGIAIAPAALLLMLFAGLATGASFALVPYLNGESAAQAQANGAIAQPGNRGSSSGPPLFVMLLSQFGTVAIALPVVVFGLIGMLLALRATRLQPPHAG
ncbi:MAG: MFS transporter [Rhodoferax sp.]|nr:MFS transporter [Rhodoferax sp.]